MVDWAEFKLRISDVERVMIALAPVLVRPLRDEPHVHCPYALALARFNAHTQVPFYAVRIAGGKLAINSTEKRFTECLSVAVFELRHQTVAGWPGFALLMQRLFGDNIAPWLPALFLAAIAQPAMPRPDFDLDEVLAFSQQYE